MSKIVWLQELINRYALYLGSIPALVTRVIIGIGFYYTGRGKLGNIEGVIEYFKSLNIPFPELQAPFVARVEYYGGILLVLGLFGRPVAAMLASTMVVALMTADKADFLATLTWDDKVPTDITAFAYLLLLGWVVCYGSGVFSLDKLGAWVMRKKFSPPSDAQAP